MKQLKKISLSQISKKEMEKRELNQLLGGVNCCICACKEFNSALDSGNSGHADNGISDGGGYGSGAFGG